MESQGLDLRFSTTTSACVYLKESKLLIFCFLPCTGGIIADILVSSAVPANNGEKRSEKEVWKLDSFQHLLSQHGNTVRLQKEEEHPTTAPRCCTSYTATPVLEAPPPKNPASSVNVEICVCDRPPAPRCLFFQMNKTVDKQTLFCSLTTVHSLW